MNDVMRNDPRALEQVMKDIKRPVVTPTTYDPRAVFDEVWKSATPEGLDNISTDEAWESLRLQPQDVTAPLVTLNEDQYRRFVRSICISSALSLFRVKVLRLMRESNTLREAVFYDVKTALNDPGAEFVIDMHTGLAREMSDADRRTAEAMQALARLLSGR